MTSEKAEGRVTHPASPKAAAATPQARRHLSPADRLPVQLSLFDEPEYPTDGMYPARAWAAAEWDMRLTLNTSAGVHSRGSVGSDIPRDGVLCVSSGTGTWFVENSAGNLTGGVFGRDTTG
jgi:hypothetical protein